MEACNSSTSQGRKFETPTARTLPLATRSSSTARIWAAIIAGLAGSTMLTVRVFCAVSAVTTLAP